MTEISSELLRYSYLDRSRSGVPEAIRVARQWIQEILKEPWWPDDSTGPAVHHGDGTTCDAVLIRYRASDAAGALDLTVIQTLFYIVVVVGNGPGGGVEVAELARRLFSQQERLNLAVSMEDQTGAVGRQESKGVPHRNYDWLDTIEWWSNEQFVVFEMLKRTGPEQGTIVRPEREANLTWFARFG